MLGVFSQTDTRNRSKLLFFTHYFVIDNVQVAYELHARQFKNCWFCPKLIQDCAIELQLQINSYLGQLSQHDFNLGTGFL